NISGNHYTKYDDIAEIVRDQMSDIEGEESDTSYILLIEEIRKNVQKLPWVDEVVVSRSLPSSLNIIITEYIPFALWQDGDNKYVINKDGEVIDVEDIDQFYDLMILTGKKANFNAKSLFNILTIDPQISRNIQQAAWIGDRRWDITFADGLLVKLPEDNISSAWTKLVKLYNMPGSLIDLKVIDLRNSKKSYLRYNDKSIRKIKNL
ncbi:MAG: cell division protein FtsQ/DivIB, partial [Proteobacteria bacterium]|nr:cell division protein FtsQ/DivIB [Pseudomonadota bacterium]